MITRNDSKFQEARGLLQDFGIDLVQARIERVEIQAEDVERVAVYSALEAAKHVEGPIIVEDDGLAIEALNGFPGPYSSFVFQTLGLECILRLMKGLQNRSAVFKSSLVFIEEATGVPRIFTSVTAGFISEQVRGTRGFGYDPLFVPSEGDGRTFAEMTSEEKNLVSHRSKTMRAFGLWSQCQGHFS